MKYFCNISFCRLLTYVFYEVCTFPFQEEHKTCQKRAEERQVSGLWQGPAGHASEATKHGRSAGNLSLGHPLHLLQLVVVRFQTVSWRINTLYTLVLYHLNTLGNLTSRDRSFENISTIKLQ